jgi:hypothetical protein
MLVENDYGEEGAQKSGEGDGADSGAYRRRSIARESGRGAGGGGEVEGDYVDEDIGNLQEGALVVFLAGSRLCSVVLAVVAGVQG